MLISFDPVDILRLGRILSQLGYGQNYHGTLTKHFSRLFLRICRRLAASGNAYGFTGREGLNLATIETVMRDLDARNNLCFPEAFSEFSADQCRQPIHRLFEQQVIRDGGCASDSPLVRRRHLCRIE